jgi:methyl-accepting chemotaxis protein
MRAFFEGNGMFELIFCSDAQGNMLNTWPRTDFGGKKNFTDRQWYKDVTAAGKPVLSDTYVSAFTNQATAPVAAPLVDASGKIIGYIGGNMKLDNVTALAQQLNEGNTGKGVVLDKKSFYLTDSRDEAKGKEHAQLSEQDVLAFIHSGEAQAAYFDSRLMAFAPIGQTGWVVLSAQDRSETMSSAHDLRNIIILVIVLAAVVMCIAGYFAARRISRPVKKLSAAASQIAGGNMVSPHIAYTGRDEIRDLIEAFVTMTENIRALIRQTSQAVDSVSLSSEQLAASSKQSAQASSQIASSAGEVAEGSGRQIQAVKESTELVQGISGRLNHVVSITDSVVVNSRETARAANDGHRQIESAVVQMESIEETVAHLAQVIAKLGDQSGKIGQIIDTISALARQTNLLALNAAIEAARAGEHGRGFSVVAEEVRKLAEQSDTAATKIAELITTMQSDSGDAVTAMAEGTKQVQAGSVVVRSAGEAFGRIVSLIGETEDGIKTVAGDVQDMSAAGVQIVERIQNIERISNGNASHVQNVSAATQEQSAALEEIAASSQELRTMMDKLRTLVQKFTLE